MQEVGATALVLAFAALTAIAMAVTPALAQHPPVRVRTLGSTGYVPGNSGLASATFYGRVSSPGPVVAWFQYQVGCFEAAGAFDAHPPPVRATGHQSFGSARGGQEVRGTGHGLPVLESSCYRIVAEVKGSERSIYGGWKYQPNFGPHGGPSPVPPEEPKGLS